MKKQYLFLMIVFFSSLVIGVQIINFDNNPSIITISFTSSQNYTYNITVDKNANFTSAFMNLSSSGIESFTNNETRNGGVYNFTSMAWTSSSTTGDIYFSKIIGIGPPNYGSFMGNRSLPDGSRNTTRANGWTLPSSIIPNCLTASYSGVQIQWNASDYICVNDSQGNLKLLKFNLGSHDFVGEDYGENFSWINYSLYSAGYPNNSYVSVNNIQIWNYSGVFNKTDNKTNNFSAILNSAINGGLCNCQNCSLLGNSCTIPFIIHSDSTGTLLISDININWKEYTKPNLTINQPNGSYSYVLGIPVNINASDNWQLSYCYFNVTRGASTEVANTQITDFKTSTLTVSGDANYVINVYCNDTSGNSNFSSSNFTVSQLTGGGGGSSGGGGAIGSPVASSTSSGWKMTTDGKTAIYDLKLTSGSSRVEQIIFENTGKTIKRITLSCQNVEGSLCDYADFDKSFELPVLSGIQTSKSVNINLPKDIANGVYIFNIYGADEEGNKNIITFNIAVGNFGAVTNFIVKSGSSLDVSGVNVPYLLIGLTIGAFSWMIIYYLLRKKPYGASVAFIIAIFILIFSIVIL